MTNILYNIDDGYNLCQVGSKEREVRTSREEKAKTHERIVEVASKRIREQGLDGPAVAEIMQAAGLTHGGFYKHFQSRDDLIAEATQSALAAADRHLHKLTDDAEDPLAAFVDWYLSVEHRDQPAAGCALPPLGDDVRRSDDRVRSAYREQVERYVEHVERFLGDGEGARQRAILAVSTLVGAVVLSRAVDDEAFSDEILSAVHDGISELP
jgi:TetR/AcrR family transcriptional regulator, transcriptional repressor for nem operon